MPNMAYTVPEAALDELAKEGLCVDYSNKVIWLEDSSAHPRNWSFGRKVYETGVITVFVTVS
jgi:hypothetical protein